MRRTLPIQFCSTISRCSISMINSRKSPWTLWINFHEVCRRVLVSSHTFPTLYIVHFTSCIVVSYDSWAASVIQLTLIKGMGSVDPFTRRVKLLRVELYLRFQLYGQALNEIEIIESQLRKQSGVGSNSLTPATSPSSSVGDIAETVSKTEYELVIRIFIAVLQINDRFSCTPCVWSGVLMWLDSTKEDSLKNLSFFFMLAKKFCLHISTIHAILRLFCLFFQNFQVF